MPNRPNSLKCHDVADALQSETLFLMQRDYFGPPEDEGTFRRFECAMEYDAALGRVELHFFEAWQDAQNAPPLIHLIAACQADGSVAPSILNIEGKTYNARRLSHGTFKSLLSFIGQTRHCSDDADYATDLATFHNALKLSLLAEMRTTHTEVPDPAESFFQWGELSFLAAA